MSSSVTSKSEPLVTREFVILAVATAFYFLGLGASNPLLPKFVVDVLGGNEATAGIVMGVFAVAALGTRSLFGRYGDRHGARRLMMIGCSLSVVGMLLLVVAGSVAMAIVARLVLGTAQAAVMTGSTVLAITIAPESRRGEAASYILVAFHLGLGIGPVLGETLRDAMSYDAAWVALAVASALGLAVATLLPRRPGNPDAPASPWIHPTGVAPGMVAAFAIVAFVAFSAFVPLYADEIGLGKVGLVFTVASVSIALARILFGRAPDILGPIRASSIAIVITIAGSIVLVLWDTPTGVFVAAGVLAGGMALQTPSMMPAAVRGVELHERTSAIATFTMFMDASIALTGPAIGLIVTHASYRAAFSTTVVTSVIALVLLYATVAPAYAAEQERILARSSSS